MIRRFPRLMFWACWLAFSTIGVWSILSTFLVKPWWEQRHGPVTDLDKIDATQIPATYLALYVVVPVVVFITPLALRSLRRRWVKKWRYQVRKALHLAPPPPPVTELSTWTAKQVLALSPGWGNGDGTVWYGTVQGRTAPEGRVARGEAGVLVIGPPRSGKTSGVIIPTILGFDGPVVSASTKPDVLAAVGAQRQHLGRLWLFDPTGTTPRSPGVMIARWSPLVSVTGWDTAREVASQMVKAEDANQGTHSDAGDFFRGRTTDLIALALYQAHIDGLTFHHVLDVLGWLPERWTKTARAFEERFADTADAGDYLATQTAQRLSVMAPREYSAMIGTASNTLAAYQRTTGLDTTTDPNFDPNDFVSSRDTLFVVAAGAHMNEVAPIIVALVDTITRTRYRHHTTNPHMPRLLLALDEIANLCPLPSITSMWSEAGGQGVTLLAAVQDLTQVKQRWGTDHGWLSLATQKLLLPGIADHETLSALSAMQGEYEHWRQTHSHTRSRSSGGGPGGASFSSQRSNTIADQYTWRPNIGIDVFAQIPDGHGRIVLGAQDAGLITLTPAHRHALWSTRTGPPTALPQPTEAAIADGTSSDVIDLTTIETNHPTNTIETETHDQHQ